MGPTFFKCFLSHKGDGLYRKSCVKILFLEYINIPSRELSKALDDRNIESFFCKQYAIIPATDTDTVDVFGNYLLNNYGDPFFDKTGIQKDGNHQRFHNQRE